MKYLVTLMIMFSLTAKAEGVSGRWFGFASYIAELGHDSYEMTLYRDSSNPVTDKDYRTAELLVIETCKDGFILNQEYLTNSDKAAVTVDFTCKQPLAKKSVSAVHPRVTG